MNKYKNQADICPFCESVSLSHDIVEGLGVGDNVQIEFECLDCGSTWDVMYKAIAVLNEYNAKDGGADE